MSKFLLGCVLVLLAIAGVKGQHSLSKRVLPVNEDCDPSFEVCRKGDWIHENIADCEYERSFFDSFSCDAQNDIFLSWTVDVAEGDRCSPAKGKRFICGEAGTNTRCVCSDYKIYINRCKCQYWPDEDPGDLLSAYCTGYYTGGASGLHHWACCDNCNDQTNTCDGHPWHGDNIASYCGACGQNTGGGRVKYYFNCGSCSQQEECENYCSGPIQNLPGLCWSWLDCFQGCCLEYAIQPSRNKRQIGSMSFCGDGTCDEGESPFECPIDCCYQINSVCSGDNSDRCSLECCGDFTCCLNTTREENSNGGTVSATAPSVTIRVLLAISVVLVLVLVLK